MPPLYGARGAPQPAVPTVCVSQGVGVAGQATASSDASRPPRDEDTIPGVHRAATANVLADGTPPGTAVLESPSRRHHAAAQSPPLSAARGRRAHIALTAPTDGGSALEDQQHELPHAAPNAPLAGKGASQPMPDTGTAAVPEELHRAAPPHPNHIPPGDATVAARHVPRDGGLHGARLAGDHKNVLALLPL